MATFLTASSAASILTVLLCAFFFTHNAIATNFPRTFLQSSNGYEIKREVPDAPNPLHNSVAPHLPFLQSTNGYHIKREVPDGPNPLHNSIPAGPELATPPLGIKV